MTTIEELRDEAKAISLGWKGESPTELMNRAAAEIEALEIQLKSVYITLGEVIQERNQLRTEIEQARKIIQEHRP